MNTLDPAVNHLSLILDSRFLSSNIIRIYCCKCDHKVYTFIKELPLYVSESLSGRFRELKNKG